MEFNPMPNETTSDHVAQAIEAPPSGHSRDAWRHENTITDWEFRQIGALLCDCQPRDLALKIVRLQGQLEVAKDLA